MIPYCTYCVAEKVDVKTNEADLMCSYIFYA